MLSKTEYINKINGLKVYVRKNTFVKSVPSTFHDYWRCGYVEFTLPKGLEYKFLQSGSWMVESKGVAKIIESSIQNTYVHGGITFCEQNVVTGIITIGFDCNHYLDTKHFLKNPRSVGYCITNIERMVKSILKAKKKYRKILINQKIKELKNKGK